MVIFIGNIGRGFFVEDAAKARLQEETKIIPENMHIEEQVNDILALGTCSWMVFDILQYTDTADLIAYQIKCIQNTNGAKVIALVPGYSMKSEIVLQLQQQGINYFITDVTVSDQKDTFEKCVLGYYDSNTIVSKVDQEIDMRKKEIKVFDGKFIGVAGSCSRIGTTSQALQIVKYLISNGFKVCYIQMNSTSFVEKLYRWYECEFYDESLGMVQYQNVDMFFKKEKISEVLNLGYDYYVYDYGVYTNPDFDKTSFMEKNIRIFVVGSFPSEMEYTEKLLNSSFYKDSIFLFSMVPENEKEELLNSVGEIKDATFFSEEVKDPFVLTNPGLYEEMLPISKKSGEIDTNRNSKKKRGLVKRKKENDKPIIQKILERVN